MENVVLNTSFHVAFRGFGGELKKDGLTPESDYILKCILVRVASENNYD